MFKNSWEIVIIFKRKKTNCCNVEIIEGIYKLFGILIWILNRYCMM